MGFPVHFLLMIAFLHQISVLQFQRPLSTPKFELNNTGITQITCVTSVAHFCTLF